MLFTSSADANTSASKSQVFFSCGYVEPTIPHNPRPRTPILTPVAELDGCLLSICDHPNYMLQLIGEDEAVVYKVPLPAGVNQVTLPASYTGQYELRLLWGNWYFFSIIE